jgi:hypothetical protein
MSRTRSQLRFGVGMWPDSPAPASHHIGLTPAAKRLAASVLEELARWGVEVKLEDGRVRFRAARIPPSAARRLIEVHADLVEAYLKEGQGQ